MPVSYGSIAGNLSRIPTMVIGFARTPEPAAAFSVDEPARSKRRLRQRGPACDQVAPRGAGDLARLGRKRWMCGRPTTTIRSVHVVSSSPPGRPAPRTLFLDAGGEAVLLRRRSSAHQLCSCVLV